MRKLTRFLFIAFLLLNFYCVPVSAEAEEYTFKISANGQDAATVEVGSDITVCFSISSNKSEYFNLYSMQYYIGFSPKYFEFVPNSIRVYKVGNSDITQASLLKTSSEVFVNRAKLSTVKTQNGTNMVSFRLKAKATGNTTIEGSGEEMIGKGGKLYTINRKNASVTIVEHGQLPEPNPIIESLSATRSGDAIKVSYNIEDHGLAESYVFKIVVAQYSNEGQFISSKIENTQMINGDISGTIEIPQNGISQYAKLYMVDFESYAPLGYCKQVNITNTP